MNKEQKQAVEAPMGYVQVIAGPGTGKTFTLIQRAIHQIEKFQIDPKKMLILTFSCSARDDIKRRLKKVNKKYNDVNCRTFHGLAYKMLIKENPKMKILNTYSQSVRIKELIAEFAEYNLKLSKTDVLKQINLSHVIDLNDEKVCTKEDKDEKIQKLLERYNWSMQENNCFDYDTLMWKFYLKLKDPKYKEEVSNLYDAVLIDEVQDTSALHAKIIFALSEKCKNLTVVGDPNQCIYQFIYANVGNLNYMETKFNCQVYKLKESYRSEQSILDVAHQYITNGSQEKSNLKSVLSRNSEVEILYKNKTEKLYETVATNIKHLLQNGVQPNEICILSRNSTDFEDFKTHFQFRLIDLNVVGGKKIETDPNNRKIIDFIELCMDTQSRLVYSTANMFIPINSGITLDGIKDLKTNESELYLEIVNKLKNYYHEQLNFESTVFGLVCKMVTKVTDMLKSAGKIGCNSLINLVKDFNNGLLTTPELTEENVKRYVQKFSCSLYSAESPKRKPKSKCVTLSTIHSAKGLEWPVVFYVDCGKKNSENENSKEGEEKNMVYVALTRAKSMLVVVTSDRDMASRMNKGIEPEEKTEISPDLKSLMECLEHERKLKERPNIKKIKKEVKKETKKEIKKEIKKETKKETKRKRKEDKTSDQSLITDFIKKSKPNQQDDDMEVVGVHQVSV